jgi:hypothetical protein
MNQRSTFALILLAAAVSIPAGACRHSLHPTLLLEDPSPVCYQLEYGPWTSADRAPFSRSAVGLVAPLPDTIALTRRVVTRYGHAYYGLRRWPQDSVLPPGTWTEPSRDTLAIEMPSESDARLRMRIVGAGARRKGLAWVSFDVFVKGGVLYDPVGPPAPWSTLTATKVACPEVF